VLALVSRACIAVRIADLLLRRAQMMNGKPKRFR
jgi:hypothetical protein